MKAIRLPKVDEKAIEELDKLYRTTRNIRIRERAQMVLLAVEKDMVAADIAEIVRKDEQTVRFWLKRYQTEGINGLADAPREGSPVKGDEAYWQQLLQVVRQHPRQYRSALFDVDLTTLGRLYGRTDWYSAFLRSRAAVSESRGYRIEPPAAYD